MKGLFDEIIGPLHEQLPCFMVLYNTTNEVTSYLLNAKNNGMFQSPVFIWLYQLFCEGGPSFTDAEWLKMLKKLLYNEEAHKPSANKDVIPLFDVDLQSIQTHMNERFPHYNWLFAYDDCKMAFHFVSSDNNRDECPLIVFLRLILTYFSKTTPFIELESFEFNLDLVPPQYVSETDMHRAMIVWLKGRDSLDLMGNNRNDDEEMRRAVEEAEQQESDDSKGKDDL